MLFVLSVFYVFCFFLCSTYVLCVGVCVCTHHTNKAKFICVHMHIYNMCVCVCVCTVSVSRAVEERMKDLEQLNRNLRKKNVQLKKMNLVHSTGRTALTLRQHNLRLQRLRTKTRRKQQKKRANTTNKMKKNLGRRRPASSPTRRLMRTRTQQQASPRILSQDRYQLSVLANTLAQRVGMETPTTASDHKGVQQQQQEQQSMYSTSNIEEIVAIRRELRAKQTKIYLLHSHYTKLEASLRAGQHINKQLLNKYQEMRQSLMMEQKRTRSLTQQLHSSSLLSLETQSVQAQMKAVSVRNAALERNITLLTQNVIVEGDKMEKRRLAEVIRRHSKQVTELKSRIHERNTTIDSLRVNMQRTHSQTTGTELKLGGVEKRNASLLQTIDKLRIRVQTLQDRLSVFSGEEMKDLERALEIVSREREDPSYAVFLQGSSPSKDKGKRRGVPALLREMHALKNALNDAQTKNSTIALDLLQQQNLCMRGWGCCRRRRRLLWWRV